MEPAVLQNLRRGVILPAHRLDEHAAIAAPPPTPAAHARQQELLAMDAAVLQNLRRGVELPARRLDERAAIAARPGRRRPTLDSRNF